MLRLAPILLAVLYGLVLYHFSAWRTRRMLDAQSRPLDDPALLRVIDRLAAPLGLRQVPVRVYEIAPVNGLAAPDGRIFLTRGFIEKFRAGEVTGEEMASVVAHEMGHVALGHARRRMIDFSGQNAVRVVLARVLGRLLPGIGFYVANFLTTLLAARLSRQDEFEADEWASALLVKAGIGTAPQKSLFVKLGRLTGTEGRRPAVWLASHPDTEARIAAIEANERRWGIAPPAPRA